MKSLKGELRDGDQVIEAEERVIEGNYEDISDLQNDIDAQMDRIFQEFGCDQNDERFSIRVKRVVKGRGELEDCFSCVPSELPIIDRVKDEYGPGAYEIWIYRNGKIFKRPKLNIAEGIKKPVVEKEQDISGVVTTVLDRQEKQTERYETLLLALINNNNNNNNSSPPPADPMAMMGAMVGMMLQMKEFMTPANNSNNFSELLENVKLIQEITDGNNGSETNILDLAKTFGPGLLEATNKLASNAAPQATPQATPQAAPQAYSQAEQDEINERNERNEKMNMFSMQLHMLVNKAAVNSDPALYADLILDSIPEAEIKTFLEMEDVIGYLSSVNSGVMEHREWFERLIGEINAALNDTSIDSVNAFDETNEINEINEISNIDEINEITETDEISEAGQATQAVNQ